ncbi:hypothetical protein LJC74_04170 [Eubacteriales bacterium OttesenSCG-928-A19]|nr:hypothetical protein [Eubacteriales bacterium OttesenSCG-928-A19]
MMKRTIGLLAALLLVCASLTGAAAETLPPGTQLYEFKFPFYTSSLVPLADGAVALFGNITHPGEYRDLPDFTGYENKEDEQLQDAYAVCLEPDGTARWSLRLGDPQAQNTFYGKGLMPDGRLLVSFIAYDTTFGSQHFIIGQDGVVEDMLPARRIAESTSPLSLRLVSDGYLGGPEAPIDDIYGDDYPRELVKLDYDLNEQWRWNDGQQGWVEGLEEGPDGFFYSNAWSDDSWSSTGLRIFKLNREGNVLWSFVEEPVPGANAVYAMEPQADGGVLFVSMYPPDRPADTEWQWPTLTLLDADGQRTWSVGYGDRVRYIHDIAPLGDGYVLSGMVQDDAMASDYLLLYVDAEGTLLGELPVKGDGERMPKPPSLATGEDGAVYAYGMLHGPLDMENLRDGPILGTYYAELSVENFR